MKVLFLIIGVLFSCNNQENKDPVSNDIHLLSKTLTLGDIHPISVKWDQTSLTKESRVPGPSDYQINAVLKLNKEEFLNLSRLYNRTHPSINENIYLEKEFKKEWFPNSIKECLINQDEYLRVNRKVFAADEFLKSPYVNGWLFFTDNDEVFIVANTN